MKRGSTTSSSATPTCSDAKPSWRLRTHIAPAQPRFGEHSAPAALTLEILCAFDTNGESFCKSTHITSCSRSKGERRGRARDVWVDNVTTLDLSIYMASIDSSLQSLTSISGTRPTELYTDIWCYGVALLDAYGVCSRLWEATIDGGEGMTSAWAPGPRPRRPHAEAVCISQPLEQALEDQRLSAARHARRPCAAVQRLHLLGVSGVASARGATPPRRITAGGAWAMPAKKSVGHA